MDLFPASPDDVPALLALNNEHAVELSWLEAAELRRLLQIAYVARVDASRHGFLLSFEKGADYHGLNFHWFDERFERFVYVDRVVVAAAARGRGLARAFYADLFACALADDHEVVCCEVNVDPPNPASDAFHATLGFREVGRAMLSNGKTVRYLVNHIRKAIDVSRP
jgi:uncharacterized protein